jgi:hypothetical protein
VPNEAFAELIREAADQVLAERVDARSVESESPEYLQEADARHRGVREDPALRAAVLLRLLEPPQQYTPVPTVAVPTVPVQGMASGAVNPYTPVGMASPFPVTSGVVVPMPAGPTFTTYTPPELGGAGPTVYGIDAASIDVGDEWAEWEFDAAIDEALGSSG